MELAAPYLDDSFKLRSQNLATGRRSNTRPPVDSVTLKGDTYYIARDNYPAIYAKFYLPYAVRVDANTGAVTPPAPSEKTVDR